MLRMAPSVGPVPSKTMVGPPAFWNGVANARVRFLISVPPQVANTISPPLPGAAFAGHDSAAVAPNPASRLRRERARFRLICPSCVKALTPTLSLRERGFTEWKIQRSLSRRERAPSANADMRRRVRVLKLRETHQLQTYFMVGMTNSAPARIPVGQREVIVFRRV